ncbi:S-adenosylmethionine-dependent methyltransferase [Martiniozyma asiatica (nom. inval.)]|nr:S-adenosylmethionine-dependent methyltransferase [Martiniozyma asiatica]
MSFDPLSFFDPAQNEIERPQKSFQQSAELKNDGKNEITDENVSDDEILLQPLDLPLPQSKPSYEVLTILLKLLAPDQPTNFAQPDVKVIKNHELLENKKLDMSQLETLNNHMKRTVKALLTIPNISTSHSKDLTHYLTTLISYPYSYMSEDERNSIYDQISKLMTSYSSPALKGEVTRKITLPDMEVLLYEPGMTGDNVGNVTWGAAGELAKRLIQDHPAKWLNSPSGKILELGAGTGLVSIVLSRLGYEVCSTDLEEIIPNLTKNLELNDVNCKVCELDWKKPQEFTAKEGKWDCLLFADPVYSLEHPKWVEGCVKEVRAEKAKVIVMLGMRDRFEDVREDLWKRLRGLGMVEVLDEVVDGWDDYGKLRYQFKIFEDDEL